MERNDKHIQKRKSKLMPSSFKINYVIILFLIGYLHNGFAQNTNTPNKVGPMGIQVNTRTGNIFLPRTDLYIPARQLDFDIGFSYNSYNFEENTGYGNGWSFMYNMRYKTDTAGRLIIIWGEGREDLYIKSGDNFKSQAGYYDILSEYQPGKYVLKTPSGIKYFFDNPTHKRLTRLLEPNENYLNLGYTDSLVTSITNAAGQTITLQYEAGKLISVTDANASPVQTFRYGYDGYGNLIKVTNPMGGVIKYGYLVNGPISSIADENDNVANIIYYPDYSARELITCNSRSSFSYDSASRATTVIDYVPSAQNQVTTYVYNDKGWLSKMEGNCCGYNMTFNYDNNGNLTERKDANGNAFKYTYDDRGNYISVTDPQNNAKYYSWAADFNRIAGITDALGNVYNAIYDAKGNLLQVTSPGNLHQTLTYSSNGDLINIKDANNNTATITYDAKGYAQKIELPLNKVVLSDFDGRGNALSTTDANGNRYSFQYDSLNRLTKVTAPLGVTENFLYDKAGNLLTYTDAKGFKHQLFYDASNRIVSYKDPKGANISFTYDAMDNLIKYTDELGKTSAYTYDNRNRITSVTDAVGNGYSFSYDAAGNMINAVNPLGNSFNFHYDQLNRVVGGSDETGSFGNISYDKNGRVISYTNASGAAVSFSYDNLNRLTKVTDPLGNARVFTYDNNGNVLSQKDRNNNTSSSTYNALNRVTSFTDNMGHRVNVEYDAQGNITKLTDQKGNSTLYEYDALNRGVKLTYSNGSNVTAVYDNNGNIISAKLADGSIITYSYDSTNMMKSRVLPSGEQYIFIYDAKRRLTSATNSTGTVTFAYDDIGRLTSEMFTSHITKYDYNVPARTMTTTYPNGSVVTRSFDKRGRLSNIFLNNQQLTSYQYNNMNQLTQKNYANGSVTNYQYDIANRLSNFSSNKNYLPSLSFQYDKEMNKTLIARSNDPQYSEAFSYDANKRLINYKQGVLSGNTISSPLVQNSYTYDALGNRISANLNGVVTNYSVNNLNQYTIASGINFTYDGNGNLTYDGNFYMRYDAEGRKLVDSIAGNIYRYQYDAFGRRIVKSINGVDTRFIYAGLQQIEERNSADAVVGTQVFQSFRSPLLRNYNNQKYFYHQNDLSSTEAITDSAGNLIEHYRYEDFGKTSFFNAQHDSIVGSSINNRYSFTGQEYDNHNSSYKFHFRNYNTATGSFNQRDPIGYDDGMGLYQYVHNNPSNKVDLYGLEEDEVIDVITYFGKDPCEHDKNKMKLITQKIVKKERETAISNAQEAKGSVDNTGLGVGLLNKSLGTSWYQYGINSDSRFYNGTLANLTGDNEYSFKGANLKSWELNYYFTNSSLADAGFTEQSATNLTTTWTNGKAYMSWRPWDDSRMNQRLQETDLKLKLKSEAYNDNYTGDISKVPSLPEELDFEDHDDLGAWFPVINPKTGEITREFFVPRTIKRSRLDALKWKIKQECGPKDIHELRLIELGTQKPKPTPPKNRPLTPYEKWYLEIITSNDPNIIIGPEGVGDNKWVSVNDRLPYKILFENDTTATAPAKVVKVIYPIDPKQDINTFQLGSFGFNNQTFNVPNGANNYTQRLDARDSLGIYVDVTAGIDAVNRQAFWIFESIDLTTQLSTTDPLKGFLLLQDKTNGNQGHGFVDFTIKPIESAHTRDTISAIAQIIFDANDTIPTNRHKNTIDALPPTTKLNPVVENTSQHNFKISWNGKDDVGGSGLAGYSLYLSVNGAPFYLYKSDIRDTFAIVSGSTDTTYCFFVAGKDSVNNQEALSNRCDLSFTFKGFGYVSSPTDYFRTKATGTWNAATTWESSRENINYYPATLTPDSSAKTITVRNGHTVTITANVITDQTIVNPLATLVATGSTLTVSNNGLTLQSDSTGTARVGNSTGTIAGNVTVQRYIPANNNRSWRLISVSTVTTQTIHAAWQNGQPAGITGAHGVGTMITSNNGNASFDFQTPGNSMLTYNVVTDAWAGISSTTLPIATDKSYFLFVRGDRRSTSLNNLRTPTTLSTTGVLKQSNYPATPISVASSKFGLIGNPYASQIDFRNITKSADIDNTFYVWDPKLTATYGVGGYQTLSYNGTDYIITPGGGSYGSAGSIMNTIESGQAFMVHATSAGHISFTENAKTAGNRMVFRTSAITDESLITSIYYKGTAGEELADGTLNLFNSNYSNSVDRNDALKLQNFGLTLGMTRDNKILSVEKKQVLTSADTIFFNLINAKPHEYRFEFIADRLNHPGLSAYLLDSYLNTNTAIDLNGTTSVNFLVTNDTASAAANRFMIVFSKPAHLTVTKSAITVYPNPVENGLINMQFVNMPKGIYTARLINALGQAIITKQIDHAEGSRTEKISTSTAKGAYLLEIIKPDKSKSLNKIIIN